MFGLINRSAIGVSGFEWLAEKETKLIVWYEMQGAGRMLLPHCMQGKNGKKKFNLRKEWGGGVCHGHTTLNLPSNKRIHTSRI